MDQSKAFDKFDDELKLDPAERREAESLHAEMTDHVTADGVIVGGFLQGSFARKTMRAPLGDIDKIFLLSPNLESLRAERGGPDRAMTSIQTSISRKYEGTTFDRRKHALRVMFPDHSFHFDAVPAFDLGDDVLIANREALTLEGEWERSNTRLLIRTVSQRNQDCVGSWVNWVRMGKEMVAFLLDGDLPGLHTESLCFAANTKRVSHDEACCRLFEIGQRLLVDGYTDPTGVDPISNRLDPGVRLRAQQAFARAATRAREAQALAAGGDDANACRVWHTVFGEAFPLPARQTVEQALAQSFAGSGLTSVGTVTATAAAVQRAIPTRSWAP